MRARGPSPAELRRLRERRNAVVMTSATLAAVVLFGSLWYRASSLAVLRDPATLCPIGAGPSALLYVLFDVSEPLDPIQREAIRARVIRLVDEELPTDTKVALFALGAEPRSTLPAPLFDRCKPPTGRLPDALIERWLDEATINLRRQADRWRGDFVVPLEKALESGLEGPSSKYSPIMEAIQALNVRASREGARTRPGSLVIVSDLLQHTSDYSHYGSGPPRFEDFARSSVAPHLRTDLTQIKVLVLYVRREGLEQVQGGAHLSFWADFFADLGVQAGQLAIEPIEG